MTREKHGNYDADRGLPDNTMQPSGSGIQVWLQEQIIKLLGEQKAQELFYLAVSHGTGRYKWLLQQMQLRGHSELVKEYEDRRRAIEAERRLQAKKFVLRRLQERLAEETNEARRVYLLREAKKAEDYIQAREIQPL